MAEFLVSLVQCACLLGYLYGAWLVITHRTGSESTRGRVHRLSTRDRDADDAVWRRYLACDS